MDKYEVGNKDYYIKTVVKDRRLIHIEVEEEVVSNTEIKTLEDPPIAWITHTGAYGQIKFQLGDKIYRSYKPYGLSELLSEEDKRELSLMYATNISNSSDVIDLSNITFNLSSDEINNLHKKYYLPRKDRTAYWVELSNQ